MNRCPQCNRTDADLGQCGATLTCPMNLGQAPDPVNPEKDVVLHCAPCGVTRAVPMVHLLTGKPPRVDHACPHPSTCACVVILEAPLRQPAPTLEQLAAAQELPIKEAQAAKTPAKRKGS